MDESKGNNGFPVPFVIGGKDDYIDKLERNTTSLALLAKNENFEVVNQVISEDKMFMISSDENSYEFYYILEGKIKVKKSGEILEPGNFISTQGDTEENYFKTIEESRLLMVSTVPIFNDLQKRYKELIELNDKVEIKDQETREHCRRLQNLALKVGEELNLDDNKLFALGYASFLHDIGKIGIDTRILTKPESLSDNEWEEMKKHTSLGRDIVSDYLKEGYYKNVAEIVHQHHEKYDGTGYPSGLKGEEIMIEARILTVVDAYDAITSERPYKDEMSKEEALVEIENCKGTHFCPKVAEAFIKIMSKN